MHSPTPLATLPRWRPTLVSSAAIALALLLSHCGGGGGGGGGNDDNCDNAPVAECDAPGDPCPSEEGFARECADSRDRCAGQCVNVCDNRRDFDPDSVPLGGLCEFDQDCEGVGTCDNDEGEGRATCRCVDTPTCTPSYDDVAYSQKTLPESCRAATFAMENGGTPGRYNLKMTCRWTDGTCEEDEDVIGIGVDYTDDSDLCWVNRQGRKWAGRFCKRDFSFREVPIIADFETGLFRFTSSTDFDAVWILYSQRGGHVIGRCVGKGRAQTAGEPASPPDCNAYRPFGD